MRLSNPFLEDGAIVVLVTEADAGWYLAMLETRLDEARCTDPAPAAIPRKKVPMIALTLRGVAALSVALALVALAGLAQP